MKKEKSKFQLYLSTSSDYEVKEKEHQGTNHLIVPVIMMVEGVHSGSHGPLFHSIKELGKFPESWNGIPVVINHPEVEGVNVSANSPDIIDSSMVGKVYNTHVSDDKLKAEVWLNEDTLKEVAANVYEDIKNSKVIEVSIGVFVEELVEEGVWNSEEYKAIATNFRPDHLALLPEEIGACSVEDGCGIRLNKKGVNNVKEVSKMIRTIREKGYSVSLINANADQSYNEIMSMIWDKLRSMDSQGIWHYAEEVYEDYLIYSKEGDNDRQMFKQDYVINGGEITFNSDPVEVKKQVKYVNVNNASFIRTKVKKEVTTMERTKGDCPDCLKKIDALIANEQSKFTEDDREWLLTQELDQLNKFEPNKVEPVEKIVEKKVEVNVLSDEDKAILAYGKKQLEERRSVMIKGILDNTEEGIWDEEGLKEMNEGTLEKVFNSVKKEEVVDYSVANNSIYNNGKPVTIEPLLPTGVVLEKKSN